MFLPLLLILQSAAAPAPPVAPAAPPPSDAKLKARYDACMDLATGNPGKGEGAATQWRSEGGGFLARQCLGVAYANQSRWALAAAAFEDAAREADAAKDPRAANYRAQAGNAWLAAGDPAKAGTALDAALAAGTLNPAQAGEAHLDRARAMVAGGDTEGARSELDAALQTAPDEPLAWLLSATLARRTGDLARARKDIAEALRRSPDDPSVQLEAGNVAAASGDEAGARDTWGRVLQLAPGSAIADAARAALAQFGATER